MYIVGNRIPKSSEVKLREWSEKVGYEFAGMMPEDEMILEYSVYGKPILELPSNSPAVMAAREIARNIKLID
jgi:CO dehydrogenase maturation factor